MFDNLLYQNSSLQLEDDINNDRLPGAILLSGPASSGKLTCALEIARVLSCRSETKGAWICSCPSCRQHKSLVHSNVLLTGPRDCSLEIAAAKKTFLNAVNENASYVQAARYFFIRSIRKLTLRFSSILWENDDGLSKIAVLTSSINESLEEIDVPRTLPVQTELVKICDNLEKDCLKLEDSFMYDSIPVLHIRNASAWAHISSGSGKKVIIIENVDRMLEGVRNALLKILEEPPADTVFVLTTTKRGAVMPTILSRVRTYSFSNRTGVQQAEVLKRVFHTNVADEQLVSIDCYLQEFLPVSPEQIKTSAKNFLSSISHSHIPDIASVCKTCGNFSLKIVLKLFLEQCLLLTKPLLSSASGAQTAAEVSEVIRICLNNVLIYNQSAQGALEQLVRELLKINALHKEILLCMGL